MSILRVTKLAKTYGTKRQGATARALNGIDLDVGEGEFVGIMGPSGSGKTTLLSILAGLDRPTSGGIWLDGRDMTKIGAPDLARFRRRELGFVFQDFNLLDALTLEENVALPLALDGHRGGRLDERVSTVMRDLGLYDVIGRYPYEVSGGQQQRTAVARAIVHQPKLVLADEPTGNLDSASAAALLQLFRQLHEERRSTLLMVTHDPLSASYCERIVFIRDGMVFSELDRSGDRHAFFQEILRALSVLEGVRQ